MSLTTTQGKFHVALDGVGLLLQGAPDRPAYTQNQAPVYSSRYAQGDRSYGDFSFWWYWSQTDWSGGLKEDPNWADDAKYRSSKNIDAFSVAGQIKLLDKPAVQTTSFTNADVLTRVIYGTIDDGTNSIDRFFLGTRATSTAGSDGARIWQSSDGDTWTLMKEFATIPAVNDLFISAQTLFALFNSDLQISNDASSPYVTFTQRTTEFNATGLSCSFWWTGADVNGLAYVIGATLGQAALKTTPDDGAVFTQRILFPVGVSVFNSIGFNSEFYYLREYGGITALHRYSLGTTTDTMVYEFKGRTPVRSGSGFGTNVSMMIVGNTLIIEFTDGSIWSVTTDDVVTMEYENRNSILPGSGGLLNHKGVGYGKDVVVKRQGSTTNVYQNRYNIADDAALIPAASSGSIILYLNSSGNAADTNVYRNTGSSYYASGNVLSSEYAEIPGIDKLWYDVVLNFATLVTGQSIQVEYSINGGTSYVSLGTASFSVEGAITSKSFLFGDAIVSKTLILRITLAAGGTDTPTLKDYNARYVPAITNKKLWNLNLNGSTSLRDLAGALVALTGRELHGRLERAWWTKSLLDFQDVDYAASQINDGAGLTKSATTVTVDDTGDFPEQGRLRIDNEEMTYTGKTPTTFTGVTRGARETQAAAHADDAVVSNAYKVILTDLQNRVPVLLEDKWIEYTVGISLREV